MKLQNNFTTPEQSKRLLELGVRADSADCYYARGFNKHTQEWNYDSFPTIIMEGMFEIEPTDIPCWSVGRLIEILMICRNGDDVKFFYYEGINIMDFAIRQIEVELKYDRLDFSKLEE